MFDTAEIHIGAAFILGNAAVEATRTSC